MAEISSADVRHWSNLPANVFLARTQIPNGLQDLLIRVPNGVTVGRQISFQGDKNIVYIRVFRDRASIMSSNDIQAGFGSIGQPISFILKNSSAHIIPLRSQPILELKR
jgi:hypothetical protein